MPPERSTRRPWYVFLCASVFLAMVAAAARPVRAAGAHHAVGAVLFAAMAVAAWLVGGRAVRSATQERRQLALGGALLVAPFALMALFWVGIGTPWEATIKDNQMRYLVLIAMAIAEVGGFVMVRQALNDAGERFSSTVVLAAILVAGPIFIVWDALMFGLFVARERGGPAAPTFAGLDPAMELLLDVAAAMTYVATAALATSLRRAGWLGRGAAWAYVAMTLIAVFFLVKQGLTYLSPAELSAWYTVPGFVFGIPAVPYVMPFLLGVVLLRRAGERGP